jgi:glutaredoxin 3
MSAEVKLYTVNWCGYCRRAKSLLSRKGVEYEEIGVDGDVEMRRWLAQTTGSRTVPQTFINGVSVGGSDDLQMLEATGKLDELLGV